MVNIFFLLFKTLTLPLNSWALSEYLMKITKKHKKMWCLHPHRHTLLTNVRTDIAQSTQQLLHNPLLSVYPDHRHPPAVSRRKRWGRKVGCRERKKADQNAACLKEASRQYNLCVCVWEIWTSIRTDTHVQKKKLKSSTCDMVPPSAP